jgi:hypothetical protein
MKSFINIIFAVFLLNTTLASDRPWQELSNPDVADVASNFKSPPSEYSMTFYWGWDGPVTEEVIARDLEEYCSKNVKAVTLEAGYRMTSKYLSPEWFELVKYTVEKARELDMHVWLVDEGKYPSGFAGGKFSQERPDLRMQTYTVREPFSVEAGQKISRDVKPNTICAIATNQKDGSTLVLEINSGKLNWKVPQGQWQVRLIEQRFRTSATRSVNNPKIGAKDATHSLCDYLKPEAVRQFIEWTHEQYKEVVGDEFGKTVLGFRGDEPDYGFVPWTDTIFDEFQKQKGYDIRPYLVAIPARGELTDQQKRAKADYWDVWSAVFSENFFGMQAKWCAENNVEYLVHLNHEDQMTGLIRSEGDFFRCMRDVQMPGIDAIWSQIWLDKVSDYPKYASSAAHLFGRPRAFTESFAAYKPRPNLDQAMWILNHQIVRGINMVEVMWIPASSEGVSGMRGWLADERFPAAALYLNRVCYVLSQGRPAAKIGLYYPTMSIWLGDNQSDKDVLTVTQQLLENQRDFDFVDEQALSSVMKIKGDCFMNLSSQSYQAIIIPPVSAISKKALDRLKSFAQNGGKVIFLGEALSLVVERTFLNAEGPADISWAMQEPSGRLNELVLKALPEPDVSMNQNCPAIKYLHRRFNDAYVYFFFNESDREQSLTATLRAERGKVQIWDLYSGSIEVMKDASVNNGVVKLPLNLDAYQTRLIVIGATPSASLAAR